MLKQLTDHTLLDCYEKSLELNLDDEFVQYLLEEIYRRGLQNAIELLPT